MSPRSSELWTLLQQKVESVNHLRSFDERCQIYYDIVGSLGDIVRHFNSELYLEYARRAKEIWSRFEPRYVEELFQLTDTHGYESHKLVRAFAPAFVYVQPSLMPLLIDKIESPYVQLKALQYANLSLYFDGTQQLEFLRKSVAAFPYAEASDRMIPHILSRAATIASPPIVPYLLEWLLEYPYAEPLGALSPKLIGDETALEKAFAIAQKVGNSVDNFICGVAPYVGAAWIKRFFLFIVDRQIEEEQNACQGALVKRLIDLVDLSESEQVYRVWCDLSRAISKYPRPKALTYLRWFVPLLAKLGSGDTCSKIAKSVVETGEWWSTKWLLPVRHNQPSP